MVYYTEILGRFDFVESDMEYITSIKENTIIFSLDVGKNKPLETVIILSSLSVIFPLVHGL